MNKAVNSRDCERGAAGIKLVVALTVVFLAAHAGYNYIPVAYDAESVKTEMNTAVLQGLALPGKLNVVDNVKARLMRTFAANNVPADAILEVKQAGNNLTARVAYQKQVNILPFGLYRYNYNFDFTATPTGFLLKQ